MNATTGTGTLHGVDDIDWTSLAPERGAEIPDLLRGVAGGGNSMASVETLYDILRFPGAGYPAAPAATRFLVAIACDPETAEPGQSLSLVLELVAPAAADLVPRPLETSLWRDEVAWAQPAVTDPAKVRAQYREWRDDAADEQQYRRMSTRLDAASRDSGAALLEAELAVADAVRERVPDLLELLEGQHNRTGRVGSDSTAAWVCYVLAFIRDPDSAARTVRAITSASTLLRPPRKGGAAPSRPSGPSILAGAGADEDTPLSVELFALGMLAEPDDATVTVALAHQMASDHLYNTFAAAVALAVIHGERAPAECLTRIAEGGATSVGYHGLFGDSWPHCGEIQPEVLGFLALGRGGATTRRVRLGMVPTVLANAEDRGCAIAAGAALDMVLGPRTAHHETDHAEDAGADLDDDTLKVLWAIAELPVGKWESAGIGDTVEAWGLPGDREGFRTFAGVEDDEDQEEQQPAADSAPAPSAPPSPGGLLGRLLGGPR